MSGLFNRGKLKSVGVVLLVLSVLGCGNGGQAPEPRDIAEGSSNRHEESAKVSRSPRSGGLEKREPSNGLEMIYSFAKNLSQAHLRSGGLLVDFGTAARHKHTLGDWRSGWRGDFNKDETTFSYLAGNTAHLFFDVLPSEVGGGKITFYAKGEGSRESGIYLNGKYLGSIQLPAHKFGHAAIEVAEGFVEGQNDIMFRCKRRREVHDDGRAALAVDYVRIAFPAAREGPAAAAYDAVRFPDTTGGPDAISLTAGESITYNLPIPKGAHLKGEARARILGEKGRLEITVRTGKKNEKLFHERDIDDRTTQLNMVLDELAGQIAAVTFSVSRGEVVLRGVGLFKKKVLHEKAPGKPRAKNFVLILIDTLRADRLSFYNKQTRVQTAYLDRLSKESMVFKRALAPENWTKPSVASILSGLYPTSHRTQDDRDRLPKSVVMASTHFQKLGFTTAGFVANGYVSGKFGFKEGWDTWINYVRENKPNRAQFVVDDAVAWLETRREGKPFFLYIHTIDPHVPYIPPRKYLALYDSGRYRGPIKPRATAKLLEQVKTRKFKLSERDKIRLEALYDGEITYHDDQLVRLHDALKARGLLDDTLIIVTSDHGEEFFEHGSVGHGHSLYEELLHVPLIVRLPASAQGKGVESQVEVSLVDTLPTACDILGVPCPEGIEGRSLLGLIEGGALNEFPSCSFSVFLGAQRAVRMGRFKSIYKQLTPFLYDLEKDPRETHNLRDEQPIALAGLRDMLGKHLMRFVESKSGSEGDERVRHKKEETNIDPETRRQLKALGYMK